MGNSDMVCLESPFVATSVSPVAPPFPHPNGRVTSRSSTANYNPISRSTNDLWDRLFDQGYKSDVSITTDNGDTIYAHSNILGMASPVLKGLLKQSKQSGRRRSVSIRGVPLDALRVFVRFLYSSRFEKEDMEEYVLHLLVMSHVYVVPDLKRICEWQLEHDFLNTDNVVDVFQLALLCDAPRLSLICHRKIIKHFKAVSATEGWTVMKQSHPVLEKEILESMVDEANRQKERIKKRNEKLMYLQLYEAMEALVHICREGCRTIAPHDQDFRDETFPCNYAACKGLESLVRHFAGCKFRVPGGCIHCKRMWQLLELHARLCADSDVCKVPLCRNFKDRIRKQSKKDETRWKILVKMILRAKIVGISPFFLSSMTSS
ncbi:hypothetical protein ACFE04_023042 [Oxalis oulophora]